ncbi:DUF86 domain-containing protein [Pollutibacter soli]|uniref:HepT-like ribonuclease domain-containing protein n=1 Tax=Pollutibacter soli TaxID=3034157 RepID=UPI003013925A
MQPEIKTYLFDILRAINEIDSFFDGTIREFIHFVSDIKTKRAIERNLEIIGEATNRIYKLDNNFDLPNIRQIIATRNRIIHGYDTVSDEILWSIVNDYLPELKIAITHLLTD